MVRRYQPEIRSIEYSDLDEAKMVESSNGEWVRLQTFNNTRKQLEKVIQRQGLKIKRLKEKYEQSK